MQYDCGFQKEKNVFRYRTGGIIINNGKMLFVKRGKKSYWDILGHILEYGETIDQRLKEILDETTSEDENIEKKLKFLCSFNAVDKDKKRHFVELIYAYDFHPRV